MQYAILPNCASGRPIKNTKQDAGRPTAGAKKWHWLLTHQTALASGATSYTWTYAPITGGLAMGVNSKARPSGLGFG